MYISNLANQVLTVFALLMIIIVNVFTNYNGNKIPYHFKSEVSLLILFPVFSITGAFFYHEQNIIDSAVALLFVYMWLFYFNLHKLRLNPNTIVRIVVAMGIIWSSINIIQQFTFPNLLFLRSINIDESYFQMTSRGGFLRLGFMDQRFAIFAAIYLWFKIISKKGGIIILILFTISLVGIFFTGTRQLIVSLLLTIVVFSFMIYKVQSKQFIRVFFIVSVLSVVIIVFGLDLFVTLIKLSEKQGVGTDSFQRIVEMKFFLKDYWPSDSNFFHYFIGNGWEYPLSNYGKDISNLRDYKLSRGDIGIIGGFSKGGIFYIVVIFIIFYKVLKTKTNKQTLFIKFFFFQLFLTSFTSKNFFDYLPSIMLIIVSLYYLEYAKYNFNINSNT